MKISRSTSHFVRRSQEEWWPRLKWVLVSRSSLAEKLQALRGEFLFSDASLNEKHQIKERNSQIKLKLSFSGYADEFSVLQPNKRKVMQDIRPSLEGI